MKYENTLPVFGIVRLCMQTEGRGITSLVGAFGCPLRCRHCLNSKSWELDKKGQPHIVIEKYSPQGLYNHLKIDSLYFKTTGGGITFGGGEPLLYAEFYQEFKKICDKEWNLTVETSLYVSEEKLKIAMNVIDDFIIDIKDFDEKIYREYTGGDLQIVKNNLELLLKSKSVENIWVRVPLIPGFNNQKSQDKTVAILEDMGLKYIERFVYKTDIKR